MPTTTNVKQTKLNIMTQEQFDEATLNENEFYAVTDAEISYNDLADKPTIGNATLTIQKNGSNVDTFTANATVNKTINITVPTQASDIGAATATGLSNEVTNRENADIGLQQQIDAITASSDVKDIVGTYAALQAYDTSTLGNNDIIKVLQDETHDDETTYYRWSTTTQTFTLIGEEGPYYTKAAADAQFVPQTRTINGQALSSNLSLTAVIIRRFT